jgi:hypothetical protein
MMQWAISSVVGRFVRTETHVPVFAQVDGRVSNIHPGAYQQGY